MPTIVEKQAESKIDATDRLRREGRWAEASVWRDEKRKQLRADGQTRAESNDASWTAMVLQFPPLPPSEDDLVDEGDQSTRVELLETDPGDHDNQPDMSRDILWVYDNLARKGVTAKDAPSLGAWSLLIWARQDRNRFFEQMLPKAMASIEKKTKEDSGLVEYDGGFKDLDKMLADHQLQWERDAVADMDATIKKTVLSRVGDWECRFHLELAPDARESWALKMMRIVDEAITAMTKHHAESQAV